MAADAVRLGNFCVDQKRSWLGTNVLVVLDPVTHAITKLAVDPGPRRPEEIDASALPRAYVAVDPATAQSAPAARQGGAVAGIVTVTIAVSGPRATGLGVRIGARHGSAAGTHSTDMDEEPEPFPPPDR